MDEDAVASLLPHTDTVWGSRRSLEDVARRHETANRYSIRGNLMRDFGLSRPMPNAQCPMPNAQCPMTNYYLDAWLED
ncbi:MAG: hypothetical protein RMY29_014835 [Nostoc sp. CreGUA01]|nr:hypothetical protein [Nostoc sp. CreGUA01]